MDIGISGSVIIGYSQENRVTAICSVSVVGGYPHASVAVAEVPVIANNRAIGVMISSRVVGQTYVVDLYDCNDGTISLLIGYKVCISSEGE